MNNFLISSLLSNSFHLKVYSVVSIKQTGWAEFFHLLHEKQVLGWTKTSKWLSK